MNAYAQTSKKSGGYRAAETVRREYRRAAATRQSAHQKVADLYATGANIEKAKEQAEQADRLFWNLDHEARRYQFFYR